MRKAVRRGRGNRWPLPRGYDAGTPGNFCLRISYLQRFLKTRPSFWGLTCALVGPWALCWVSCKEARIPATALGAQLGGECGQWRNHSPKGISPNKVCGSRRPSLGVQLLGCWHRGLLSAAPLPWFGAGHGSQDPPGPGCGQRGGTRLRPGHLGLSHLCHETAVGPGLVPSPL